MLDLYRRVRLAVMLTLGFSTFAIAQQTATSGTFVLHKFAKAIGSETYSIEAKGDSYTLTSHFEFTDRGTKVPLEATFVAEAGTMKPVSYSAKGKSSRISDMDDTVTVSGKDVSIVRSGKSETETPSEPWFITDGYSPAAMQEQMMRWWLSHDRPESFTVYPSKARVRIAAGENLSIAGAPAHGYTVSGLIWGQESLWMDDSQNLMALVSADAEFDHFEAVREPYEANLQVFIAAAVKADLSALAKLTQQRREWLRPESWRSWEQPWRTRLAQGL